MHICQKGAYIYDKEFNENLKPGVSSTIPEAGWGLEDWAQELKASLNNKIVSPTDQPK